MITRPGRQKSSYWTGFWNNRRWIIFGNIVSLGVKIIFLHIMSSPSLSEITSKFRTLAMFITVYLQTVFYACCVGMFMICVDTTLLMPSPIADDVASQFDHCLEGSIGFGHIIYRNFPQLFVSE